MSKGLNTAGVSREFIREAGPATMNISVFVTGTPNTPSYTEHYTVVATVLGTVIEFSEMFTRALDEVELSDWMAKEIGKRLWMNAPHILGEWIH